MMKVLITGSNGFVGKNLVAHLSENENVDVVSFTRQDSVNELTSKLEQVDLVFHLAGVNRPENVTDFKTGNADLTESLCLEITKTGRSIPIIYTSSIQAELDNPYGESKQLAEESLQNFSKATGIPVYIYRLPNLFGKWCRPDYNSVVATFCHNISHDLPIKINDSSAELHLVYIDDLIAEFMSVVNGDKTTSGFCDVNPVYEITLGRLAEKIYAYKNSRDTLLTEAVGSGLDRALHSTYLSYLDPANFSYELVKHGDPRGVFVEMLKTKDSGQFSFFTAHPGITRGGHYHHTKTEKFLVLKGRALFKFRHIMTDEYYEIETNGDLPKIVETVPGWTHDITNTGEDEMIVMLWANENFDKDAPDTYARPL